MEGLSILGGLAKGFALGKQQQFDREKRAEEADLKKQMLKMQIEAQKTTLLQHQMKQKLLDALLPKLMGQQPGAAPEEPAAASSTPATPEFGESFRAEMPTPQGQKAGLTDTMSMMQMFKDPQTLALLKMADIDLVDIARMDQTQQQNLMTNLFKAKQMEQSAGQFDRSEAQRESQFQRSQALTGSAVTPQTITLPDGSQAIIPFRTHGGGGGGAPQLGAQPGTGLPGGFIPTAPQQIEPYEFNEPSTGAKMQGFRNKVTKEVIQNSKPVELEAPKGPAVEAAGKIAMAVNAVKYFDEVSGMAISDIKRDENGKIVGGKINRSLLAKASAPLGGLGEGRAMNSKFRDAMDARIRAATGAAINASEIPYYESVYKPSVMDPDSLIFDKLNRAQEFLHGYLQTLDPSGRTRARMGTPSGKTQSNAAVIVNPKTGERKQWDGKQWQTIQ